MYERSRQDEQPLTTQTLEALYDAFGPRVFLLGDAAKGERMILTGALGALPPEQREVVYLKVFEGMTFQEIAERCGVRLNTAASRYRYATAALRKTLAGSR